MCSEEKKTYKTIIFSGFVLLLRNRNERGWFQVVDFDFKYVLLLLLNHNE